MTNGTRVEPPKRPLGPLPRPPPAPPINGNSNGTDSKAAATKIEGSDAALKNLSKVSLPDISVLQVEKKEGDTSAPVTKIIIYKSKDGTKKPTAKLIIEKQVWQYLNLFQ